MTTYLKQAYLLRLPNLVFGLLVAIQSSLSELLLSSEGRLLYLLIILSESALYNLAKHPLTIMPDKQISECYIEIALRFERFYASKQYR